VPVRSIPVLSARANPFPYAGAKKLASEQVSKHVPIFGLTTFAERMLVLSSQIKEEEFPRANKNSLISFSYTSSPDNDEILIF